MSEIVRRVIHSLPQSVVTALITSALIAIMVWTWESFEASKLPDDFLDFLNENKQTLRTWLLSTGGGQDAASQDFNEEPPAARLPGPFLGTDENGNLMLYDDQELTIPLLGGPNEHDVPLSRGQPLR